MLPPFSLLVKPIVLAHLARPAGRIIGFMCCACVFACVCVCACVHACVSRLWKQLLIHLQHSTGQCDVPAVSWDVLAASLNFTSSSHHPLTVLLLPLQMSLSVWSYFILYLPHFLWCFWSIVSRWCKLDVTLEKNKCRWSDKPPHPLWNCWTHRTQ